MTLKGNTATVALNQKAERRRRIRACVCACVRALRYGTHLYSLPTGNIHFPVPFLAAEDRQELKTTRLEMSVLLVTFERKTKEKHNKTTKEKKKKRKKDHD